MAANNGTGKIGGQELGPILSKEKDPRWDDEKIVAAFVEEAMEWLDEPATWGGKVPRSFKAARDQIQFYIAMACFNSFNAAIEEFEALCRAFLLGSDDEDYPEKYLPKD